MAEATSEHTYALVHYGRNIGLAFQVIDDLLDREADGADASSSYAALHGPEASEAQVRCWMAQAHQALLPFGERAWMLHAMADFIVQRKL